MKYYSQAGQDKWVHELIGDKGFFVDVGAYDGIQTSNTYALELAGWQGICIEGERGIYRSLRRSRKCICVNAAVTNYTGTCSFGADRIGEGVTMQCFTLDDLLGKVLLKWCPKKIDYLSMDIEGEELNVLTVFDFSKWDIKLITVEHNLYCDGPANKDAIYELLTKNGFTRVKDNVLCPDPNYLNQPFEDWYAKLSG